MLSDPLTQTKTNKTNASWSELVVISNRITWPYVRNVIDDIWPKIVSFLSDIKGTIITNPSDEAWFHLRRAFYADRNEIDILRLKGEYILDKNKEKVNTLLERYEGTVRVEWRYCNYEQWHDNVFFSFLQKLSNLRIKYGICYDKYLAGISDRDYAKCPYCQEAYKVMLNPNSQWYLPLTPWFDYMSETKMDEYKTHEYAHWFGHILSGWPDEAW
jgi:hypothetical protein